MTMAFRFHHGDLAGLSGLSGGRACRGAGVGGGVE